MRDQGVNSVIEAAMNSPKVGAVVAGGLAGTGGVAIKYEIINNWLAAGSMAVGIVTGLVVLAIQGIRLERAWRQRNKDIRAGLL